MDRMAYYLALMTLVTVPATLLAWLLVHGLVTFWRRIGRTQSLVVVSLLTILAMGVMFLVSGSLLHVHFAFRWPLAVAALVLLVISAHLNARVYRDAPRSMALGLAELSGDAPGRLITTGIYSRLRHPRFSAMTLAVCAMALLTNYAAVYALFAVYVGAIYSIALLEERELLARFGREYVEYARVVPRFIPRLSRRTSGARVTPEVRRPNRGACFLLSLATIVFTLLALEVTLRATHVLGARVSWTQPDPLVGFRFTPGRAYWSFTENDHPVSGRINSHGWRDRERSFRKEPGTFRVALLGDSLVEAFQVESDSTFAALVEDELRARLGTAVEVMNFGRSGVTQTEELIFLRNDVMEFAPDVVAVLFNPTNDIGDVASRTTRSLRPFYVQTPDGELALDAGFCLSSAYRARRAINGIKQHSALVSLLVERYNVLERSRRLGSGAAADGELPRHLTLCTAHADSSYSEGYGLCKRLISCMAAECSEREARFLLICGGIVYQAEDIRGYRDFDATLDPRFFETDLAAFADSLHIDYLGLQTPFMRHAAEGGGPLYWSHYNYAGHRLVAQLLAGKLEALRSAGADVRGELARM